MNNVSAHRAFSFLLDHFHRFVQLGSAIAAARTENIARHARRMHAHQHRFVRLPLPFDQGHMIQPVARLAERDQLEMSLSLIHI